MEANQGLQLPRQTLLPLGHLSCLQFTYFAEEYNICSSKCFLNRCCLACKQRNYSHYVISLARTRAAYLHSLFSPAPFMLIFFFFFRNVSIQNIQLLTNTSVFIVEIISVTVAARIMERIIVNLGKALTQIVPVYHPQKQNRHNFKHLKVLANKM